MRTRWDVRVKYYTNEAWANLHGHEGGIDLFIVSRRDTRRAEGHVVVVVVRSWPGGRWPLPLSAVVIGTGYT